MLLLARLSLTTQLVPNPVNWSQTHSTGPQIVFLTDISVSVAQMKKNPETKSIYFRTLPLGRPSPPSQLVLNPFNWYQTPFFLHISLYRSLKSKFCKNQGGFIFKFCFSEDPPHPVNWSPTHSIGPQLIQLVSKCIPRKFIFPKCIYPKCICAKCTRLACLLSFASLFYLSDRY